MRKTNLLATLGAVFAAAVLTNCTPASNNNDDWSTSVCQQAAAKAAECGFALPAAPPEGCVDSYATAAEELLENECPAAVGDAKSDSGSWYCKPGALWMGLCKPAALAQVAKVSEISELCVTRRDALCAAAGGNDIARATEIIRERVRTDGVGAAMQDPVTRAFLRDRTLGIFASEVYPQARDATFRSKADALLASHFPGYPAGSIPLAHTYAPVRAGAATCPQREALLIFPGVVRLTQRDEFEQVKAVLASRLPCLDVVRIETQSFVAPTENARIAAEQVAALDRSDRGDQPPRALHFMGYSQGASNALVTLATYPVIAKRTRSVFMMNSAGHGSEVADVMLSLLKIQPQSCDEWLSIARPLCENAAKQSARPADFVIELLARAMSVPVDEFAKFMTAEGITQRMTVAEFLRSRMAGVESLTTNATNRFWAQNGVALPQDTLYFSFRSVISSPDNLPRSNALFAAALNRVDPFLPWNDMQVRLVNQGLNGPLVNREVLGRVAEGNHWQWQLKDGAVPEILMPRAMSERTPDVAMITAHYLAMFDVGVVLP